MSRIQLIPYQFPLSIGILLARDSIDGIPIPCSVSLPASHFTRTVMHDPVAQLRCDVWYTQSTPTVSGSYTISWSKEKILDIGKALANKLHDLVLCLVLG